MSHLVFGVWWSQLALANTNHYWELHIQQKWFSTELNQWEQIRRSVIRELKLDWVDKRILHLLFAHFSGTGRESSLPVVSSVVASGFTVVVIMSIGTVTTTPSATLRQILRNFSISPGRVNGQIMADIKRNNLFMESEGCQSYFILLRKRQEIFVFCRNWLLCNSCCTLLVISY